MNPSLWWSNLVAYSVQVAALVIVGALLPLVFGTRLARAQLLYYQVLLAVCLALPAAQPWRRPVVVSFRPAAAVKAGVPVRLAPTPARGGIRWEEVALAALASGALLRGLWLAVGLWRLRRYRIESDLMYPLPEAVEAARLRVGADAIVLVSDATTGPVTFGFLRPVILLPGRFRDLAQEAVG